MQVFCAIVEQGTFIQAADVLNISKSMVSKHLTNLEQHLQAKLLQRNNRQQSLTEVGERYYQECCHALKSLENARLEAQQNTREPQGTLKITAPIWFANSYCTQLFAEFSQLYPNIKLALTLENQFSDLIAKGFDVALRITNNPQDNLIAKPLTPINLSYVATPAYLAEHGAPASKQELSEHKGILPSYVNIPTFLPTTHTSNNTIMLLEMTKASMGIAILPERLTEKAIQDGDLIKLFPMELTDKPLYLYVAYMNRTFLSVKVRCFLDFLSKKYS